MSSDISIKKIKSYFSVDNFKDIVTKLFINPITHEEKKTFVSDLISKQTITTLLVTKHYRESEPKINWMVANPTTQLTSSFNPIIKDAKEWYGEYYCDN